MKLDTNEIIDELLPEMLNAAKLADLLEHLGCAKADLADFATKADLADLKGEFRELRTELKADIRDLNAALRSQVRTFVVTQVATVFGVAGLVVAIQQLL